MDALFWTVFTDNYPDWRPFCSSIVGHEFYFLLIVLSHCAIVSRKVFPFCVNLRPCRFASFTFSTRAAASAC